MVIHFKVQLSFNQKCEGTGSYTKQECYLLTLQVALMLFTRLAQDWSLIPE